jgi:hypothetical protein
MAKIEYAEKEFENIASAEVFKNRLEICSTCEHFQLEICTACSCPIFAVIGDAGKRCPVGKWEKE